MTPITNITAALMVLLPGLSFASESLAPDRMVVYKTVGATEPALHIFNPRDHAPGDRRPAIVFFFGGGWAEGTPAQFHQQAQGFADRGFVAMSAVSSAPNAMILFNPVVDTTEKGYGVGSVGHHRKTEISPCHHVRNGLPPTLLSHGTADGTVPFENAERFARLMQEAGNR